MFKFKKINFVSLRKKVKKSLIHEIFKSLSYKAIGIPTSFFRQDLKIDEKITRQKKVR